MVWYYYFTTWYELKCCLRHCVTASSLIVYFIWLSGDLLGLCSVAVLCVLDLTRPHVTGKIQDVVSTRQSGHYVALIFWIPFGIQELRCLI